MKTDMQNTTTYIVKHPVISGIFGVFALAALTGFSVFAFTLVQPTVSDAFSEGPPCCDDGGINDPNPIINPVDDPFPGIGGGGGGGGTPVVTPIIPYCELAINPNSITEGGSASLVWDTSRAISATIDQGIGTVSLPSGSQSVSPTSETTYTMTVTSSTGHTALCADTVVVTPPVVNTVPACTLTAGDLTLTSGETTTITWTTTNATEVHLQHLDAITPNMDLNGSITTGAAGTYTLTASDADGDSVTCSVTIEVTTTPDSPVCTLVADPTTITLGGASELTWTTTNGSTFHIGGGVGSVTPVAGGDTFVTPASLGEYTYVGVVTSSTGETATCSVSITVVPPVVVNGPACTFEAEDTTLTSGQSTTLTWTTTNATEVHLQHLDAITPDMDLNGSITTQALGLYTLTAISATGESVDCTVTLTRVVIPPGSPACTFEAEDTTLEPGQSTTLTWTTTNATEVRMAHLDTVAFVPLNGSVTTQALGIRTLTAISAIGESVDCTVTLTRVVIPPGLACTLEIDRDAMRSGESADMIWTTTDEAVSFTINGETKDLDGMETIRPAAVQTHTYTGIATNAAGDTVECSDSIQVNGGTGGGLSCSMSFTKSAIRSGETSELQWSTRRADSVEIDQGIGSVALTGTETVTKAGVGTHEYVLTARGNGDTAICRATLTVSGGSGGCTSNCGGGGSRNPNVTIDFLKGPGLQPLAFVTLSQIPYTGLELGSVGTIIYWIILIIWSGAVAYLVLFKFLPYTGRKLRTVGSAVTNALDATEESTMDRTMHEELEDIQMDGFAPKANDEALSVEDIVRGLSRMHQERTPVEEPVAPVFPVEEEPVIYEEEVVKEMSRPPVEAPAYTAPSVDGDDMRLLNALMNGDRDTSFSMLRRTMRNGGRPELLLEKALVHLDTAYRARIDGIACSEDVRRICAQADTALLEEVINALATAVDTTYSQSQTGAKLALTRAHAVIERG